VTYVEKAEKIASEDREQVRSELASVAEWFRNRYPSMDVGEINQYLHEMVDVSV